MGVIRLLGQTVSCLVLDEHSSRGIRILLFQSFSMFQLRFVVAVVSSAELCNLSYLCER